MIRSEKKMNKKMGIDSISVSVFISFLLSLKNTENTGNTENTEYWDEQACLNGDIDL